jgi:succinyl-diaminopimelate desuccinylase
MTSADIHDQTEAQREDVVALCARLVAAHSVNPQGDTRAVAGVVAEALASRGLTPTLHTKVPTMPSVVAEIDSGRPGRHLVLNVHLDTMPAGDESAWSVDPWTLTRKDGRLYGLGMGNMKGAVAAAIAAASMLAERRDAWSGRVTFTAVSDEVVFGDNGAAHLLDVLPDVEGDAMICGEGAGFRRLAVGEKGVLWLAITATGDGGHSSAVRPGASASARIAAATTLVDGMNGRTSTRPAGLESVTVRPGDVSMELTANVGTLTAGTFVGQIATHARAEVDFRVPPGMTIDGVQAEVARLLADVPGVTVERIKGWDPNWTASDAAITRAWLAAAEIVDGEPVEQAVRLPASDASRWRQRGVPALCFGPQPTFSAGIDDHAEEDEVLRCVELYTRTALAYLADESAPRGAGA